MAFAAAADTQFSPYAASQLQYDSNVFALPSRDAAAAQDGDPTRADTVQRYRAGVDARYRWGRQALRGSVEGRHFDYWHFGRLDHDEYTVTGGLDWVAASAVGGALEFSQERRMAPFLDRNSTELTMETDRSGRGHFDLALNPEWSVRAGFDIHRLDSPLPAYPGFALDENAGDLALRYLGAGKLALGLYTEYVEGGYSGVPDAAEFRQATADLTADYAVSGVSEISARLGYSQRQSRNGGGGGDVSGTTGSLEYRRHFSVKTSGDLQVFRRISSYVGGTNSVVDTGAGLGFRWEPDVKLAISPTYTWTQSVYHGLAVGSSAAAGRRDHFQDARLDLDFRALPWLSIRPFARYRVRGSNSSANAFNEAMAGIDIVARLGTAPAR